jgi:DNA-binding transcriptional LysR family regulator
MELDSLRIFVKVVQNNSFSQAAKILKVPVSTVSRTIKKLEAEMRTTLLTRTTRTLTLTQSGKILFDRSVNAVLELEEAAKSVEGSNQTLSGIVKLTATEDYGTLVVNAVVGRLIKSYPGIKFDLYYTNEVIDLVKGGFDLAIRLGHLNSSRFKSIRLGAVNLIAVAAPGYLQGKEKILTPKNLSQYQCLVFGPEKETTRYKFLSKKEKINIVIKPNTIANQMQSLVTLSVAGAGVAFVPHFVASRYLSEGSLVRILPEWTAESYDVHLVSPSIRGMPARVKLVADELSQAIKGLVV